MLYNADFLIHVCVCVCMWCVSSWTMKLLSLIFVFIDCYCFKCVYMMCVWGYTYHGMCVQTWHSRLSFRSRFMASAVVCRAPAQVLRLTL